MIFTKLAVYFVAVAMSASLLREGMGITTAAGGTRALTPIAGDWAGLVFAVGIIGTGALAVPVLAGVGGVCRQRGVWMADGAE